MLQPARTAGAVSGAARSDPTRVGILAAVTVVLGACGAPRGEDAGQVNASASRGGLATSTPSADGTLSPSPRPGFQNAIPAAIEEELPAVDISRDELTDLYLAGTGLGISADDFVTAWNAHDDLQPDDEVGRYFTLRIQNLALEPVGAGGFAVSQHVLGDAMRLLLVTDADEALHSAVLIGERGATGDVVRDGVANLEYTFAQRYFVSAVNPRLDEFERSHVIADMIDLDGAVADGVDGLNAFYGAPLREMIVVKGVRYDMARDQAEVLYLVATGE